MGLTQERLERAILDDELLLYFQPKICLLRGQIVGAEALVRWNNPAEKIIPPTAFLPLAVHSGLLHDITVRLLDQAVSACKQIRKIQPGLAVSMNVAPNDLEPHKISDRIRYHLDQGAISATELQIEITETAVMGNFELIKEDLERLTGLGIKLLMDDFGTGFSSLDRLSQLPFTYLKLDQGVVQRMGTSPQNLNVVKSAISMARELRMTSVAEGIESAGAYNFLIANGCEEAQGYFIAKPMALTDYLEFIRSPHDFHGSQIGKVHQAIYNILYYRKCLFDVAVFSKLDLESTLPSVMDPDVSDSVEASRFGVWYYGIGQELAHYEAFSALAVPTSELHIIGQLLQQQLLIGDPGNKLDKMLLRLDTQVDHIVSLLHALERELLPSSQQR